MGTAAVVDAGGNLVAVERIDGTFGASWPISIGKARTAALFQKPTSFFEDVINKGRTAMTTVGDFTPLKGGVPVVVDGQIVGAVGVSSAASAAEDEELSPSSTTATTAGRLRRLASASAAAAAFFAPSSVSPRREARTPVRHTSARPRPSPAGRGGS